MQVHPQAVPYRPTGTAVTTVDRQDTGAPSSGLRHAPHSQRTTPPANLHDLHEQVEYPTQNPKPSGDLRIDGYTLWAYSDVFKGLVLDIRL